jgi:hypothetical protein
VRQGNRPLLEVWRTLDHPDLVETFGKRRRVVDDYNHVCHGAMSLEATLRT